MKNKLYSIKIILAGFCLLIMASCEKDLLDKKPLSAITDQALWSDPALVGSFVSARYNQISHGWYSESWVSSMSDETFLTWSRSTEPITQGYVNPSTKHSMNGGHWGESGRRWDVIWKNIANCNLFFDNVEKTPFTNPADRDQLKAEVTFIRALMYWDLINRWGGMPLITKSYDINTVNQIANIKRNSYKENIDFLVAECDKAIAGLPATATGGRASSVAARALKSRILLYAASPLMNDARSDDPEFLVHYQTPDGSRWQKAATAAQEAIDAALANGKSLYVSTSLKDTYTGIFTAGGNPEVIFDREGGGSANNTNLSYIDEANGPNGYGSWGGNTPIQEFVDAFEMIDGSKFSWSNPTHAANPFQNRDPRMSAYILVNGDQWKGRAVENYVYTNEAGNAEIGGKDTQYGSDSWNTSQTSYNMRKFLDPNHKVGSWTFSVKNWIWFRLGELYLNLAEAKYNAGDEGAARTALNVIRTRAGMPNVTAAGTALRDAIYNERRIELAFEEHRYFDVRRWKIAETVLNKNATGIIIKATGTFNASHVFSPSSFTYTPGKIVEKRAFTSPAMYWLPIQKDEIDKNQALQQNPGY